MVGPKKQDFLPKINILKGNHCILRIRGAPVHQKLGMILENKVVQKLKLEKWSPNSSMNYGTSKSAEIVLSKSIFYVKN